MSVYIRRRTPGEQRAYVEGYEAGVRVGAQALATIAEATAKVCDDIKGQVDLVKVLASAEGLE